MRAARSTCSDQFRQLFPRPAQPARHIHHAPALRAALGRRVRHQCVILPKADWPRPDAPTARCDGPDRTPAHSRNPRNLAMAQFSPGQQLLDSFHKMRCDHGPFSLAQKKSPTAEKNIFRRRALVDTCLTRLFRYPLDSPTLPQPLAQFQDKFLGQIFITSQYEFLACLQSRDHWSREMLKPHSIREKIQSPLPPGEG